MNSGNNGGSVATRAIAQSLRKGISAVFVGALLATPVCAGALPAADYSPATVQDPEHITTVVSDDNRREAEQDARDREQERRERTQERADRMQELYDEGREALDDGNYQKAGETFSALAQMNGPQADAALYWKAYSENQAGKRDKALATVAALKAKFPQSRWKRDAEALQIEVQQSTGRPANPESQSDEELKTLALQGLMNNDPHRGIEMIERRLSGSASPKEKAKMLFVLAQNGSPESEQLMEKIALGQSNPELQRKAVEYLGIFGGVSGGVEGGVDGGVSGGVSGGVKGGVGGSQRTSRRAILDQVYAQTSDESVKRAVIRSYMMQGNKQGLFQLAKSEKNEGLKRDAIRQLGLVGGQNELQQLYQSEASAEVRREILQGFFLAGESEKLSQIAQNDKDPELRRTAVRNLGLMGKSDVLNAIYAKESDRGIKEEVLNAYFISGNAKALVAAAKAEKDPELKRRAVEKLALMNSKEGSEYLMELLNK